MTNMNTLGSLILNGMLLFNVTMFLQLNKSHLINFKAKSLDIEKNPILLELYCQRQFRKPLKK